jgi:hypothetical protein
MDARRLRNVSVAFVTFCAVAAAFLIDWDSIAARQALVAAFNSGKFSLEAPRSGQLTKATRNSRSPIELCTFGELSGSAKQHPAHERASEIASIELCQTVLSTLPTCQK